MINKNKSRITITLYNYQIEWLQNHAKGSNLTISNFISKVIIGVKEDSEDNEKEIL